MVLDGVICIATGYFAYSLSLEIETGTLIMAWNDFIGSILFLAFVNNYLMGHFGFYSEKRFPSYLEIMKSLIMAVSLDFIALSTVAFMIGIRPFPRIFVVAHFLFFLVSLIIIRITLYYYLDRRAPTAFNSRQILLIGTRDRMEAMVDALDNQRSWGHQVAGCLSVDGRSNSGALDIPVLGNLNDFDEVLLKHRIDEAIFALPRGFPIDLGGYLQKCEEIGVAFRIIPGLFDFSRPTLREETLQGIPTLTMYSESASASGLMYKRILDVFVGFFGFIVFLILYPVVGLAIKMDTPGPALFRQIRVGLHNRPFRFYKFRTMVADAESKKSELLDKSDVSAPMFKMTNDPRITRIGRFLRKASLDEFPQFINVLKGEMSLVGTRPPILDEMRYHEDWHRRRISIKPGITGLWQISGRNEITDFAEIVKLDLQYIDQWRLWRDLVILWKTIWVVLARKGAK